MLTPHIIGHLTDLVHVENAAAIEIEYDSTGRVFRVTSLDGVGEGAHATTSDMLTPQLVDACQAFVDSFDKHPEGGSLRFVPEDLDAVHG